MSENLSRALPATSQPRPSALRSLIHQEWKDCRNSMTELAVVWITGLWVLAIFQHPVWLMILGLIHVLTVTSSQAGRDVIDGTEEFSFTLPPGRGPLFLSRFTPGLVFLTANGLLGGMAIAADLPQRLWSLVFSSGLTEPFPLVGETLWYAMALLVPVAAHSLTFTFASLVGTRAGVNLSWMAGFAGVGAIVLAGNIAEKQLWRSPTGLLTIPALLAVAVLAPFVGYRAYLCKEASGSSGVMENKSNVKGLMTVAAVVAVIVAFLMLLFWLNSVARRDAAAKESRQRTIEMEEHVRRHSVDLGNDAAEH
jgi:hypothetical protein